MTKEQAKGARSIAKKALNKLSGDGVYSTPNSVYVEQLRDESDRGVIVLLATLLEDALKTRLKEVIPALPTVKEEEIFGYDAPFGSFSKLALCATAFGIITPELREIIDHVRAMRNKAAHLQNQIVFEDEPMRGMVMSMLDSGTQSFIDDHAQEMVRHTFVVTALLIQQIILGPLKSTNLNELARAEVLLSGLRNDGVIPLSKVFKGFEPEA
ncbi:hypothetical protein SFC76_03050 [Sphingomonas sp. CD22]|uniref:hypothetical protein n=1 Tax=Sphingomonas sp. CD22 TaxID=3100214 RepID=UPI002AE06280|nr:hypothetical protein [Sphingomonas sp. CD22]MEA1083226.1 hypothetical protein [Sphingomonas sp. CD22]